MYSCCVLFPDSGCAALALARVCIFILIFFHCVSGMFGFAPAPSNLVPLVLLLGGLKMSLSCLMVVV